jgi:hypothetical protein
MVSGSVVIGQDETDPAELAKQYDRLKSYRFYRHASYVYDNLLQFAQRDPDTITPHDQFIRAFYEGRWQEIQDTLKRLPESLANSIYNKMLTDLTGRNVPVLTLDDFIGLSDACPSELNADRIRKQGLLLRTAVSQEQEVWLRKALKQGTRYLGGQDAKRLVTGRVLMHANFDDLAREYLPSISEASQIEDQTLREEIVNFLASQEELEQFQQTRIADLWEEQAGLLTDPRTDGRRVQTATDQLAALLGQASATSVEPWIRELVDKDTQAALRLSTALGKRATGKIGDRNTELRANNLKAQKCLLVNVADRCNLAEAPWNRVAIAMANWWVQEAEHTFEVRPEYRADSRPKPHVLPEDLLESAPEDAWSQSLPLSLQGRIDVCMSKAVLVSDQYEQAVEQIVAIAKRNPEAGITLAEEYLKAWAHRHDPHIPETIRRQHKLAANARIVVTPIMMEKNITSLAKMMDIFRDNQIQPRNGELVLEAFNVCYSNAEVYQKTHITKVFGPIEDMDEKTFSQMITMMTDGLSSRWRDMQVQETSGTGRSRQETLQMVRGGYRTAIEMIDQRCEKHPQAWRTLALAGSLMSDWGDFEYFQQLVSDNETNRMEAFRQKNSAAARYFRRAAEVYAEQVPELNPPHYSVDAYVAWFQSLIGINTNGNLNLSKPLDRTALNEIREMIRDLPDNAGRAHVDMFAKHVNARMEDTAKPLHEKLKYKYLAGSLIITKSSPFSFQAGKKVNYYDELLDEIRLETRVDGPNTVHRDQEFGIILSVYHTEAMGRMANFGQYLTNEVPTSATTNVTTYDATAAQGRRDLLELNIQEALGLFFDIKAIAFSSKDVVPRATERPGWEETVLAYIQAKVKDSSVDKIPRIQMNLEFLDLTGPVTVSAESAETMIKVTDKPTPPRPYFQVEMTQTVDARDLESSEEILLEIRASACGLVPEIDDLLDLKLIAQQLPVVRIDPHQGTLLRQVDSWGDTVHAVSEREWTIALDAARLLRERRRIQLNLPRPQVEDVAIKYQTFVDMDLVDLDEPVAFVGKGPVLATSLRQDGWPERWVLYAASAGAAAAFAGILLALVCFGRRPRQRRLRARDVFHMPKEIDGFVTVQLLRALGGSELVRLSTRQREELRQEMCHIQTACFGKNGSEISEEELRRVAKKWLRIAG